MQVSNESQNEVFAQTQNVRQRIAAVEEARREAKRKYESAHRYDAVGCKSAEESDDDTGFFLCGVRGPTIPDLPALTTQESSWSESGLTATYDIPGLRTIVPSPNTRGQKIASVSLKDIHLSYLLVPKLRAAAFLKARLHNSSSITLLKVRNLCLASRVPEEHFRLTTQRLPKFGILTSIDRALAD